MSFFAEEFFGGGFFGEYYHKPYVGVSVFFGGEFFDGGFFQELEQETAKTGGKGDNASKKRSIYKPTGLPPYRVRKTVEQRVEETREIHQEVLAERKVERVEPAIQQMSLVDIDAEIARLLHKKLRTEDEELLLLLLAISV